MLTHVTHAFIVFFPFANVELYFVTLVDTPPPTFQMARSNILGHKMMRANMLSMKVAIMEVLNLLDFMYLLILRNGIVWI